MYGAFLEPTRRNIYSEKYLENIAWLICDELNDLDFPQLRFFGVPTPVPLGTKGQLTEESTLWPDTYGHDD